jgi:hypothetical protein
MFVICLDPLAQPSLQFKTLAGGSGSSKFQALNKPALPANDGAQAQ